MMEWNNPETLYLILPLGVAWLMLVVYSDRRRHRARQAFAAQTMWNRILPEESRMRFWCKQILRLVAMAASLVALAGPRFGTEIERVVPRGSDLYVLIDVSRSMLAEDVAPSRLGRAKSDVSALVNRLEGERVGLIAFAGQAVVKCPLTVDYDSFRRALQELDPSSAPRGGTAIGDAIRKGLDVFQGQVDREQAMLLITDGDDQESYPLEAAEAAAEHHVTIFTVGLGDSEQGARIPQQDDSKNFVEYQGEQIWSKMDGSLLGEIALKTSGVYVPAGTRAYDLGELYTEHLQNRFAKDAATQERSRRSEQYQIFLAMAVIALLIELCIAPYRRSANASHPSMILDRASQPTGRRSIPTSAGLASIVVFVAMASGNQRAAAVEPYGAVRQGLQLYLQEKYDAAREKFAAAVEELEKQKSPFSSIAVFDEACAFHRQADIEKAREGYLRAGISQDRSISVAAHFNLGTLAAEQARSKVGDQPELVAADKRQEILDHLMQATVAYRHCLEIYPEHVPARRNLELVRQWIKYYSDQWRAQDRQKRRDESNLMAFLQFVIDTQTAIKETVESLPSGFTADGFAELKQSQTELSEEIPWLKEKLESELHPPAPSGSNSAAATNMPPEQSKELEEGIRMLQGWADAAGQHMLASSKSLGLRAALAAVDEQQAALDELDKIWEAIVPFHPLLAKEIQDQTMITHALQPDAAASTEAENAIPVDSKTAPALESIDEPASTEAMQLEIADDDLKKLEKMQERTLRKARLLSPKAAMELKQLESAPPSESQPENSAALDTNSPSSTPPVDPEQAKAGYRKAVELAPQAVEYMDEALKLLQRKDTKRAAERAAEALRILEEIQQAQPKNQQEPNQDKQEEENKGDDQKKDADDKKEDQSSQDPPKADSKDDQKKQDDQPSESKKKDDQPSAQEQPQQQQQAKMSPDRIEEALRKVRERQEDKREKDREWKAKILGRLPVDKDW